MGRKMQLSAIRHHPCTRPRWYHSLSERSRHSDLGSAGVCRGRRPARGERSLLPIAQDLPCSAPGERLCTLEEFRALLEPYCVRDYDGECGVASVAAAGEPAKRY